MGCPFASNSPKWGEWRQKVCNRFVVVHSKNDGMLAYVNRIESGTISVSGLTGVEVEGIENYDASETIESHFQYMQQIRQILLDLHFNSDLPNHSNYSVCCQYE